MDSNEIRPHERTRRDRVSDWEDFETLFRTFSQVPTSHPRAVQPSFSSINNRERERGEISRFASHFLLIITFFSILFTKLPMIGYAEFLSSNTLPPHLTCCRFVLRWNTETSLTFDCFLFLPNCYRLPSAERWLEELHGIGCARLLHINPLFISTSAAFWFHLSIRETEIIWDCNLIPTNKRTSKDKKMSVSFAPARDIAGRPEASKRKETSYGSCWGVNRLTNSFCSVEEINDARPTLLRLMGL